MAEQEYTPTEADREMALAYQAEPVTDDETSAVADLIARVRADERAKRLNREQLEEMAHDWADNADGTIDPAAHRSFLAGVDAVLSSLALEPEAREEKPPVYLASDLWYALRLPDEDAEFDGYYERNGWADTWSNLLAEVRLRSGARPCGQDTDGEPCVLMTKSHLVHYGASDVGSSEPLPGATTEADAEQYMLQIRASWDATGHHPLPNHVGPFPSQSAAFDWVRHHAPLSGEFNSTLWPVRPEEVRRGR